MSALADDLEEIAGRLIAEFEAAPLFKLADANPPQEFGVYALYYSRVRYVGVVNSRTRYLRGRLSEHSRTFPAVGYDLGRVYCRWLVLPDWFAPAAGSLLISTNKTD